MAAPTPSLLTVPSTAADAKRVPAPLSATHVYSPHVGPERLIASLRVLLAVSSLAAMWLEPGQQGPYATTTHGLLLLYTGYATVLAVLAWGLQAPTGPVRLATHGFDLTAFSAFVFLTEGPSSPLVVYFVFALLSGALRWRWRGVLWTGVLAVSVFISIGVYAALVLRAPNFQLADLLTRSVYLAVVASFLGYLTAYEDVRLGHVRALAKWPRSTPGDLDGLLAAICRHVTNVVASARIVLVWEESDEPVVHLAEWDGSHVRSTTVAAGDVPSSVVAAPLAGAGFFAVDAGRVAEVVIRRGAGAREWHGQAVHDAVAARFEMHRVVCAPIDGEEVTGHIFFLDGDAQTLDAIAAAERVAVEVGTSLDHHSLHRRLRVATLATERLRLGRDLHDGVLQALTGARLQLRALAGSMGEDVSRDRARLIEVERTITAEQVELRTVIQDLKSAARPPDGSRLPARLRGLADRIERQWRLPVNVTLDGPFERLDDDLAQQTYLMVHEAVINVARHAQASLASVTVTVRPDGVGIRVRDDGRGFRDPSSEGGVALKRLKGGPASLTARVSALGGSLNVQSTEAGATVEIEVPRLGGVA